MGTAIANSIAIRLMMSNQYVVMMSVLLAIGISAVLALWLYRKRTKLMLEKCGLPTVTWYPRFATYKPDDEDAQKMASTTITRILPRMKKLDGPYGMYGTVYGLYTPVIHVAHPVPAKAILGVGSIGSTSPKTGNKRNHRRSSIVEMNGSSKNPTYNHFKNFSGEGTFSADGDDWKAKRASIIHCLIRGTNSATSDLSQCLEKEANRAAADFCHQIEARKQKSCKGPVVANVVPIIQRATVGLIYRYITHDEPAWMIPMNPPQDDSSCDDSVDSSSLSSIAVSVDSNDMGSANDKAPDAPGMLETYMNAIIRIRMIVLAQSRSIWFLLPNWCYRVFSSMYRDEEETLVPIRDFSRVACSRAKPGSPLAKLKEMESHKKEKDILDESITLLFAGQDTSAATLSWTLHLLSLHPDVQEKLAQEVRSVLGGQDTLNPHVTRKMISQMPYLDAVIKESMRLYPVAPFVARQLLHDVALGGDDQEKKKAVLPAGAVAIIWIHSLHQNPALWNRPQDFLPERWMNPDMKDVGQTNGAYMPFAAGPRNCVGQPLAQVVLRTVLSKMIYRYEFHDSDGQGRKDMQAGFTVLPTGGLPLSIRNRG